MGRRECDGDQRGRAAPRGRLRPWDGQGVATSVGDRDASVVTPVTRGDEPIRPEPEALQVRLDRARAAIGRYDYRAADDTLTDLVDQCAALPDEHASDVRVRALISLATTRVELSGDVPASLALLEQAASLARRTNGAHHLGVVVATTAYLYLRTGAIERAMASFGRLDEHLDDLLPVDRATALNNRGALLLDRGEAAAATVDLDRALADSQQLDHLQLQVKALHNLGYAAYLEGDLPRALARYRRIDLLDGDPEERGRLQSDAVLASDRAKALLEAGLADDADDMLDMAIAGLRGTGRLQDLGEAHLARARCALISGDLELAAEQVELARTNFARRGNPRWARRAAFTQLAIEVEALQRRSSLAGGSAVASPGDQADAATRLVTEIATLLDEADRVGDDETAGPARSMLAEAAVLAGDLDRARAALRDQPPGEDEPVSVRLRWYRARAGLAGATGPGLVQPVVREGLGALARAQGRLGSMDLRTAIAIHGRELAELGVGAALDGGDEEEVHAAVELAHASSTRVSPVRPDVTPHERRLLARLRRANDAQWHMDATAHPDRAAQIRSEVSRLQAELRHLEWLRVGDGAGADIIDLATVRAGLAPTGAVVASFTAVGSDLYVICIDGATVEVVSIAPLATVTALVERLRSDLQAVALPGVPEPVRHVMHRSVHHALGALDDLLVTPLGAAGRSLVVVPHGSLALVPWSLLDGRRGLATTTVPCLTAWTRATSAAGRGRAGRSGGEVVALAGPGLLRAEAEVTAVADTWPSGRTVVGDAATGAALRRAMSTPGTVHLAAHGTHQVASPLFSSLRLADGPIFAHDLDRDLASRLVVLSACEVGSHTVRRGDEPLGLTAALLQAGVPTVLAGLARVGDDVAHDVMIEVHRGLAAGDGPAAALGVAVASAWDDGRVAPFACTGAGLVALA